MDVLLQFVVMVNLSFILHKRFVIRLLDKHLTLSGLELALEIIASVKVSPVSNFSKTLRNLIPLDHRAKAKTIIGSENFIEVYLNCDLAVCEERDVKGLYKKARNGEIKNFTGIDSPYEVPKSPDIELESARLSIDESVDCILDILNIRLK